MRNSLNKFTAILMAVLMLVMALPTSAWGTEEYSNSVFPGISLASILPGNTPVKTFNFYIGTGEDAQLISTQRVTKGDILYEPEVKTQKNEKFTGWSPAVTFGEVTEEVTENEEINVYAQIEKVYYVFFKDPTTSRIVATKEGAPGTVIDDFGNVQFTIAVDERITGWKNESEEIVSSVTLEYKDITLTAIIEKGYWITFVSNGGSYIAPDFYPNGSAASAPGNPTKPGYSFDNWYKDKALTQEANFAEISSNTTLYAAWKANDTSYTVIHWWENADDNGYSYYESETVSGASGIKTNAEAKTYKGFTAQAFEQETIAGDGSTIINVYYDRIEYSVSFFKVKKENGKTVKGDEYTDKRITAKHGAKIRDKWPGGNWNTEPGGNTYQANIDVMPLGGFEFFEAGGFEGESSTAYYYVEALEFQNEDDRYVLDHKDQFPGANFTVTKEDRYPIKGFTCDEEKSPKDKDNYNGAKFYYNRNTYKIVYYNGGSIVKTEDYKYEADISHAGEYTPVNPPAGMEDFSFAGWYLDIDGKVQSKFSNMKMPADNIIVYAKWTPPQYTVNFFDQDGKNIKTLKIDKGATIPDIEVPAITLDEDQSFLGWTYDDNKPFSLATKINRNYDIYAHAGCKDGFNVTYDANGGEGEVPYDGTSYAEGAAADIRLPGTLSKEGEVFLGWAKTIENYDKLYQPGDKLPIEHANVTLFAIWGKVPETTKLTYNSNFGDPVTLNHKVEENGVLTENITNNTLVPLYDDSKLGDSFKRQWYKLIGWNTNKEAANSGTVEYGRDASVIVNVQDSEKNILYAVWERCTADVIITKQVTGNIADTNKEFAFTVNSTEPIGKGNYNLSRDEMTATFALSHNHSITLSKVPVGVTLTITEELSGYKSSMTFNDAIVSNSVTVQEGSNKIVVINNLEAPVPTTPPGKITLTGVRDMWMYYIGGAVALLILAIVIVHFLRRKGDGNDEK